MATSTYTPLYTTTISGTSTSSVSITVPSGYTDLVLVCVANDSSTSDSRTMIQFNNDGTNIYSSTDVLGTGSAVSSSRNTNRGQLDDYTGGARISSGQFAVCTYHIMNYANTNVYKTVLYRQNSNDTTSIDYGASASVGLYRSTNAITSIQVIRNGAVYIGAGSTFSLYGIKAA